MSRVLLTAIALAHAGCWLGGTTGADQAPDDQQSDTTAQGDGDVDADADSDGDAPFACSEEPSDCDVLGATFTEQQAGCCYQNQACFCVYLPFPENEYAVHCKDCSAQGGSCYYDDDLERVDCTEEAWSCDPPCVECDGAPGTCADIGATDAAQYAGCCWSNTVYWCDNSTNSGLVSQSCAAIGQVCDYDSVMGWMDCVEPPWEP